MTIKQEEFEDFELLYGTSAEDNDRLSTELAFAHDFWLHAAGYAGSHVVVRNPTGLSHLPTSVEKRAAELAVLHSKAKNAKGKIDVHLALARDVHKPKGYPPGKVVLGNHRSIKIYAPKTF